MNIEYLVAPYEADAQLAYLSKIKYVNLVITEDSDLLVYDCERVLFQLDSNGYGFEISIKDLNLTKELNFSSFTKDMFIQTCILSGCDYINSIPGIGLKTAHSLINKFKDYKEVIRNLIFNPKYIVPQNYENTFEKAFLTFKLQLVYCPIRKSIVHLTDILKFKNKIDKFEEISFLGKFLGKELEDKIVSGDIDPNSLEPFKDDEETSNFKILDELEKLSGNQTTLNKFFPNLPKKKKTNKNVKKLKMETKIHRKKRTSIEIYPNDHSANSSYLKKKKNTNEILINSNNLKKENKVNLIIEEKFNTLEYNNGSSDFEQDNSSNHAFLMNKSEKNTYNNLSDFETGSFNFEDFKYKDEESKKSKKKVKAKSGNTKNKITFLERRLTPINSYKSPSKKKNIDLDPLLPIVVIDLESDVIQTNSNLESYYYKG